MINKTELIEIGKIQKTHALKGELNAIFDIDPKFTDQEIPIVINIDGIWVPFFIESYRKKGNTSYLIKIEDIDSEDEAKLFVNKSIFVLKEDIKTFLKEETDEDLISEDDLHGFDVINAENGKTIGRLQHIDDSTANILMHIEREDGNIVFIPFVEDWIVELNDEEKKIIVNLPDGILDIN